MGVDRPGYLLDANVLSELLKPSPNQGVVERVRRHWNESTTAAPVYHEMLFGARRLSPGRRREMIEHYLDEVVRRTLQVLPYDTAAAAWHAGERARLSALGQVPPFVDGQIAAIAQTNGLTLITANVADFRLFTSLNVEDWTSPHGRADLP